MKTRIFACIFALLALLVPTSCAKKEEYRDDLTASELAERISRAIPEEGGWTTDESGAMEEFFTVPDSVTEHTVRYSDAVSNIDEFGIYHITRGGARALEAMLTEKYLSASYLKNREWYDSYIPTETPKLRDAETRTYGNYVVYAIMGEEEKERLFEVVEEALEK